MNVIVTDGDLLAQTGRSRFSISTKFVSRQRHTGIDQGRRNFAVVAEDMELSQTPVMVAAAKYDLQLGQ